MLNVEGLYHTKARRNDSNGAIEMRGRFQPSPFTDRTYQYVFVPDDTGPVTFVIPVYDSHGLIDIIAVSSDVWGAVSGAGRFLGSLTDPLKVHRSPADWIAGDIGVLPLSKSFLRTMPSTATIA